MHHAERDDYIVAIILRMMSGVVHHAERDGYIVNDDRVVHHAERDGYVASRLCF